MQIVILAYRFRYRALIKQQILHALWIKLAQFDYYKICNIDVPPHHLLTNRYPG